MNNPSPAPDAALLRRFLLGELSGAELDRVAAYLERHPEVAATLDTRDLNDTLVDALRKREQVEDGAELAKLMEHLVTLTAPPATPRAAEEETHTAAPTPTGAAEADDTLAVLAPADRPGDLGRLGRYRVLRVLGRGGMGVVFEAEDDTLKRHVALKVMRADVAADPDNRKRFVREAETAARVEHDNIVPAYDVAEIGGVPVLAMPLLVGEALDARLKRQHGPLPVAEVLLIGRQVAEGLVAAHAAGLVHRDIKPNNVWLERTAAGAFKRARILDFGLARSARDATPTRSGAVLGTPAYMAPEQARGEHVDHRADLFSLGCVLYQMAAGRRPFRGDNTLAVLTALAVDTPPPADELNPQVPVALADLIDHLLRKNPIDRWPPTAREVSDELARIAADPPSGSRTALVAAAPPQAAEPPDEATLLPPPAASRARARVLAACAVLVALLAVAGHFLGGTVIRIASDKGELVVEVDDPNIEVKVVRGDAVVHDKTRGREWVLTAGDGEVAFLDPESGATGVTKRFRIARGGKTVVSATAAEIAAARPPKPKPKKPDEPSPPRKVGGAPAPAGFTPEQRKAIAWVLANGQLQVTRPDGRAEHLRRG